MEEEKKRAEDLEEKRVYVQTKQYIEKVAKEKLGLVNPERDHFKSRQLGIFSLLTEYNADERLCP